jgi:hypothetical protein
MAKMPRCSSGKFKGSPMIRQIVGRRHVGETDEEVVEYAKTRLRKGAWDTLSRPEQRAFECEVRKAHRRNQQLYMDVMRGW